MATSMASASIAAFLQARFFKPVVASLGVHVAFYFFGAVCLISSVYILIAVPETKMRSVDEIYAGLKTKKERQKEIEKAKEMEGRA